ncbi:UvrD-helicase domain-containing protein [Effusibacillus pohliae]|uniref:UvrD-helicase domain-containing protein n=1 Tax=Effusibacillus pohliae TaxID=232270 RepID=UPI00035E8C8B|nr:UvrD-helicase domain-containing protein [Effusibacillus pohliae]
MTFDAPIRRVRNPQPNEAQAKAIENLDQDLLVAAGAGSGKTWVLTERYMEMLVRGARPGQIVAITFTELAAAEMKRRIRTAVEKWIAETADLLEKKRLRRIRSELDSAIISTIHGFCMRILKEHPVEAGVDPLAEVLEPDEARRLLEEAVEEVLEAALRERFAEVQPLYLAWGGRRGMTESLLQAYEDMQMFDYPVDRVLADTERSLAAMRAEIETMVDEIDRLVNTIVRPELGELLANKKQLPQYAVQMEAWVRRWEEKSALLRTWDGVTDPQVRRTLRDLRNTIWRKYGSESLRDAHERLKEVLLPKLMRLEVGPDAMDRARSFCRLLEALEARYQQKKDRRHALDFHDLERITARMLERYPDVAALYGKRFRFVMIDEFQDTNRLQKSILDRITSASGNVKRFLVGDGKQSIYKFRGADVDVFQEVEEEHRRAGGDRLIDMGVNFRTQAGIINYINDFFANLMQSADTEHVKQVRFAPLHAARNPAHGNPCVEILVHSADAEAAARDGEADLIARRIRELVDNRLPLVYRKRAGEREETPQPVRYGDIAILFSATTHLQVYEQALQRYGIPYTVEKGRQFYKKQEIADLCAWLTAIVDPADEVALAALLRSPVVALSDETLFWLAQEGSIQQGLAVMAAADAVSRVRLQARLGEAEFAKTVRAVRKLSEWRESWRLRRLTDFLESILRESGYLQMLLAGFGGEQRYANVLKLLEIAEQLQRKEGYGVAEFVEYLKRMRDEEVQETEAQLGGGSGSGGGAVRLMTVHASKGLEFPVVILPDLKRPLQTGDTARCLIRPGMGIGLKAERYGETAADGELEVQGDGLFLRMKEQESERELLEEHRKLYVAMTRARDYLILAATKPKRETTSWQKWILEHAGFPKFDEIACGILEKGDPSTGYRIFVNGEVGWPAVGFDRDRQMPWQVWRERMGCCEGKEAGGVLTSDSFALLFPAGNPDSLHVPMLSASAYMAYRTCERRFFLKYLFRLPELRRSGGQSALADLSADSLPDREEEEIDPEPGIAPGGADELAAEAPDINHRRVHADLRGTLVHELFEQLREPEQAAELIRKQVESTAGIRPEERPAVIAYLQKMADRYLNSRWFHGDSLREQPFYLKIGPTMLHGFIDLILPEADGSLTVVDFKTNEIRGGEQIAELAKSYEVQLQLYALAARSVFQKPVKRALLFFLDVGESVEVNVSGPTLDRLLDDLRQTCSQLLERCTIDSYPMTNERAVCGRCGYRTLCGRSESGA